MLSLAQMFALISVLHNFDNEFINSDFNNIFIDTMDPDEAAIIGEDKLDTIVVNILDGDDADLIEATLNQMKDGYYMRFVDRTIVTYVFDDYYVDFIRWNNC